MPKKIEGIKKYTVLLNEESLEAAQATAVKLGVPLKVSGNTSAFLRYLVDEFAKRPVAIVRKKVSYSEV